MTTTTKVVLGVGIAGALGALIFFLTMPKVATTADIPAAGNVPFRVVNGQLVGNFQDLKQASTDLNTNGQTLHRG